MAHTIDKIDVNGSSMEIFMYAPEGDGPHPGIVLCQHIPVGHTGVENDEFTLVTAQRYADAGFYVVVPFIFHWWPKEETMEVKRDEFRDDWTALDLQTSFDHLAGQIDVDEKIEGIAVAYTMGSMKIAGNMNEGSNMGGVAKAEDSMTEIAVSFAF